MISSASSINPESFSKFGESHGWSGTFPMDLPKTILEKALAQFELF